MQRGRNTLILLIVATAVGAYGYFVESKRAPASEAGAPETRAKVFDKLDTAKIEDITIKGSSGEQTRLKKTGAAAAGAGAAGAPGAWQIVEPVQSSVDDTEVTGLISNLGSVEVSRVVEDNPKDLGKYGLAQPRVQLAFTTGDKSTHQLLIGTKTATGGDLYAKLASDKKVILIPAYLESTFDRTSFQLRDKSILKFDRDKVDALEIATSGSAGSGTGGASKTSAAGAPGTPGATLKFAKQGEAWKMTAPVAARTDSTAVDNVIGRLATGQMKALTAPEPSPADLATYGLAKPEIQVTLAAGSARTGLLIGKPAEGGDLYAKDAARPMVFTLEKGVADDIRKTPADFRTKDLFDAKPFTTTHLDVTRGGATTTFEKTKVKEKDAQGKEKEAVDKWTQTQPQAAKPVDASKIDDAVGKITGLRADSFLDKLPAGATELLTINTKFDEGKKSEKVVVHKAGADYYATRTDDAGAAKLATTAVDGAIKALDAVK
jgi:hypothetical protein